MTSGVNQGIRMLDPTLLRLWPSKTTSITIATTSGIAKEN